MMRSRQLASFCQLSQKRSKTHVLTKSLYIKTWFVCLNKFECLKKTLKHFKHQNMIHDVSLRSVSNSSSECLSERCSRHHHWETNELNFSDQCQTKFLLPKSQNEFYDLLTIPSCTSAMILPAKLKQNIWKMVWFSMLLCKFKSSRCSPCNQSTQRRRKVYRCWVSTSPIKRAKYETCKYNVNHHGWAHHQGENQIHSFQCRKDQWIHLTTDVKFSHPLLRWTPFHV